MTRMCVEQVWHVISRNTFELPVSLQKLLKILHLSQERGQMKLCFFFETFPIEVLLFAFPPCLCLVLSNQSSHCSNDLKKKFPLLCAADGQSNGPLRTQWWVTVWFPKYKNNYHWPDMFPFIGKNPSVLVKWFEVWPTSLPFQITVSSLQ